MNVVGQMWMREEQLKPSVVSFSFCLQRENREAEIVSGMEKEKYKNLHSIKETYIAG